MRTILAAALVVGTTLCGVARADRIALPAGPAASVQPASLPTRGMSEQQVEQRFGLPGKKYRPVGGDTAKHPPITRWDYPGFSVFFEHTHVVDAVVPGHPPRLYHTDRLAPAKS